MTAAPWAERSLHFVGLGGAGMSGLALVARALGARVSGSDRVDSPYLERVRAAGVDARIGHDAANLPEGDAVEVVVSTAIGPENPERAAAAGRGLRERHRGELLAEVAALKRLIAVAGAHGKTTTTSMVTHALLACGLEPAYLIGGDLRTTHANAAWGAGEWIVVEADESDRSFLRLTPEVAVVTNVELDHHATYPSRLDLDEAFRAFLAPAREAVLPGDDAAVLALTGGGASGSGPRVVAFDGWDGPPLAVPGAHNARNAAAALAACVLAGADREEAARALAGFAGARRRFEALGTTASGARIVDDYAHHPTEVAATVAAAREIVVAAGRGRVVAVYPARERAEDFPEVTGRLIAEGTVDAAAGGAVLWLPSFADAEPLLRERLRPDDLCLVLGAGNVDALGRALVD